MASVRTSAAHYAEALFEIARADQSHDRWVQDLQRVQDVLSNPIAGKALTSPVVADQQRVSALNSLLPDLRPESRRFVALLIERERLDLVPEILAALQQLIEESRGVVRAEVITAVPLDERQTQEVARRLAVYSGKQVRIETSIDPDIIGGVIAQIGDERIDDSVRGRLQRLKQRLAQGPLG
jgi:F-type H+-transporting ATPase subunit delta